jgi:ribonuclease P protein component
VFKITTLKVRAQFQRVRGGGRATAPGFVLEGKPRSAAPVQPKDLAKLDASRQSAAGVSHAICGPRFGFTITKKIGNAVTRNLIRRRLRAALSEIAKVHARADTDYVVVARPPAADQAFALLTRDLITAFKRVHLALKVLPPRATAGAAETAPRP